MKKILSTALIAVFSAVMAISGSAKIELPHIFADNMVLQQQTNVNFWGKAKSKSTVTIAPSWEGAVEVKAVADKDGNWKASVPTASAGGPYTITISDGKALVLKNVLLGEVWLCSGQSNMAMPMKGNTNQPVEGGPDVISNASPSVPIRMCTVALAGTLTPQDDCEMTPWLENKPEAVSETSAVAYFFAKHINSELNVPVGIIVSSWGGSVIETWMDRETISSKFSSEYDISYLDRMEMPSGHRRERPCLIYNAMLHPLIPFTVKGVIWYQGESNTLWPKRYVSLQTAFVEMLRKNWNAPELPFYYVQIAPYKGSDDPKENSARIREAQMKALSLIPNSGMAVTLDIGEMKCIHPAKKSEVGQRLALLALEGTYGIRGDIDPHSPIYKSWETTDGKITVSFDVGPSGLAPLGQGIEGFEVAGTDKVFHPATAQIEGRDKVVVKCDDVAEPVAVRYCFHNWCRGTLFNASGIPASSFRTDEW